MIKRAILRFFSVIRGFFRGFADVVSRLNLLGRVVFGFLAAVLVAGIVLAIALPQRGVETGPRIAGRSS